MPGKATGVDVIYRCGACKGQFVVYRDVPPDSFQFMIDLEEGHEDCPAED